MKKTTESDTTTDFEWCCDKQACLLRRAMSVVHQARLVYLAWAGDGVDDGAALRGELPRLGEALDTFDRGTE